VIQLALFTFHVGKVLQFSWGDLLRATSVSMKVLVPTMAAQGVAAVATSRLPPLASLVLVATVSGATWLGCIFAFQHPIRDELVRAWRAFRGSRIE
jgi:hypothetical protein